MSSGTAFCFLLVGVGLALFPIKTKKIKQITQGLFLLVLFLAFIGMVTHILLIPGEHKAFFFETMAFHTSILFLIIALYHLTETRTVGYMKFFFEDLAGSFLLRKMILFIVFFPFVLSYLLLSVLNDNILEMDFAVALYTITLIFLVIIYFSIVAQQNNIVNLKNEKLKSSVSSLNDELLQFNEAINEVTIVAITDKNGIINRVNNNFCQISQYSEKELIGQNINIIDANYHKRDFFKNLWEVIETGEIWSEEIKNKAKDGSFFWVKTAIIPLKDKAGNIEQFMAIQEDITKSKKAKAILKNKNLKLVKKNRELEQFTYIASHDLQEPLRTITSFSKVLTEEFREESLSETAKDSLRFINQSTDRMRNLIKGLLDFARLGRNEKLERIKINQLVNEVEVDLNSVIEETKATIISNDLPTLFGYETSLRLLFQNLISNAIKFRKPDVAPEVTISAIRKTGRWEFWIQDNGIGINEEQRERVFILFQRLHLKSQYEGTGIGLAHCQKIVEMHDGEIWIDVAENGGSIFKFTISDEINTL